MATKFMVKGNVTFVTGIKIVKLTVKEISDLMTRKAVEGMWRVPATNIAVRRIDIRMTDALQFTERATIGFMVRETIALVMVRMTFHVMVREIIALVVRMTFGFVRMTSGFVLRVTLDIVKATRNG